ncbi:MAG: MotE family protein [Parvibaculaceae bacterium]
MLERLRLLPTVMLVAAMLLGLKVVHMIGGLSDVAVISHAEAQAAEPAGEAAPAAEGKGEAKAEGDGEAPATPEKVHNRPEKEPDNAALQAALDAQSKQLHEPAKISDAEMAVLGSLTERREAIDKHAKEIETREQLLSAAEKRVEDRIVELKALEAKINSQIATSDAANEERLKGVVQMYETMKPKDAARIFERLDMGVLVDVTKRMSPRKLSAVLSSMDPAAAQDLTVELATGDRLPDMPDQKAEKAGTAAAPKPAAAVVVKPDGQQS